jgi:hypothetical protein
MEKLNEQDPKPQQQTAQNPEGEPIGNPFENSQASDKDVQQSKQELENEQQFKEAQTERD